MLDPLTLRNDHCHGSDELEILLDKGKRALKEKVTTCGILTLDNTALLLQVLSAPLRVNRIDIYNEFMVTWPPTLTDNQRNEFMFHFPPYQNIENTMWR